MLVGHLNTRSLIAKLAAVRQLLDDGSYSILTVTETWLSPETSDGAISISGYNFERMDRGGRGGGVGMYVKEGRV